MYKVNGIQKRINSKRKLTADLLALAEGLRVKNNYSDLPRVNLYNIDSGFAIIYCGKSLARSEQMSAYILRSEDLRGFLEANRQYKPKAAPFLIKVNSGLAVYSVRIDFSLEGA